MDLQELLKLDTSGSTRSLGEIRAEINQLRQALLHLNEESEEYQIIAKGVAERQKEISGVMNASKKNIEAEEGSMNSLLATLRSLKEQWKATGDEARRAELGAQISDVKARINGMNESIGNFQHNVGNYSGGIIEAFNKMGLSIGAQGTKLQGVFAMLSGGLGNVSKAFKSLWATMTTNPIGIVIASLGALVGAFSAVSRAIHENEESEMRLHKAMAAFRPWKDSMTNWLDEVGKGFVAFSETISQAVWWLKEVVARYNDWRGVTEGDAAENVRKEREVYESLADSENKLIKIKREVRKLNARDQAHIDELREEAMDTEDLTKKAELLNQAKRIQEGINKRNISQAKAEFELMKAQASLTANSTAKNNELAEAEAKVSEAEAAGARSMRGLTRELNRYTKAAGSAKTATDELLNLDKVAEDIERELKGAEDARMEAEFDNLQKALDLQQQEIDKRKTAMQLEQEDYEQKLALLQEFHLSTEELTKNHEEKMAEFRAEIEQREYEELLRQREAEKKIHDDELKYHERLQKAKLTATKNMASGTSSILKNLSAAMGESTKLGKGFAIAAATIDTIASAVTGFRAGMNQWADAGPMAWMGPVQAALNATMALTAGFAEVQKIRSVDTSGNANAGGGGAVALAIPNIEGLSNPMDYTRQVVTETEREEMNRDNRVYILESDIQESGQRVRVREQETTF